MKSGKRILIATVAAVLLFATFVTCALALVAGEDTIPEQYMRSKVVIEDNFDDGEIGMARKNLELTNISAIGQSNFYHANAPNGYVQHSSELAMIEDGSLYKRTGADNVYTADDESADEANLYYNINYYKKGTSTNFYYTMWLSNASDGANITAGGLVYECDVNFWHPLRRTAGAQTTEKDDDVWENYKVQTAGADTSDTSDDVWEIDLSKTVIPTIDIAIMNSGSGASGSISLMIFRQARERDESGNLILDGTKEKLIPGYVEAIPAKGEGSAVQFPANYWQHLTIQYDPNGIYRVYVGKDTDTDGEGNVIGRQLVLETTNADNNGAVATVKFASLRIGAAKGDRAGEFSFDNVLAYQSSTVHNPKLFDGKTESEIVRYLADVLQDESSSAVLKSNAYELITNEYLAKFWDGKNFLATANDMVRGAIADYFDFKENKYQQMLDDLKIENTKSFIKQVQQLDEMPRTLANVKDRNSRVTVIDNFIASVGAGIDRADDGYKAAMERLSEIRTEILRDENSAIIIDQMSGFQKSYSIYAVSAMEIRYNAASEAYINYTEPGVFTGDDLKKLTEAIEQYRAATDIIALVRKDVNSERFINLVGLYKDTTEEDWASDDGTIRRYWYLSRSIILDSENYNPDFAGMTEAKVIYDRVTEYFWKIIQEEHIKALSEQLELFNNPGISYVEQEGICAFVKNYVKANDADIDYSNSIINELIKTNGEYEKLLSTFHDDYQKVLVQNTEKFISIMPLVSAANDYASILPLFNEATSLYYSMNINDGAATEATLEYERIRAKLIATEADCTLFIAKAEELAKAQDNNEVYKLLSECYAHTKNLDVTYEGVAAAKAIYDAKMAEHEKAVVSNMEIAETTDVVCSVRSFDTELDIIKLIKNLLGM